MPYVIDGNNVIGSSPELATGETSARHKLIDLAMQYQKFRKTSIILVFDGPASADETGPAIDGKLTLLYSEEGESSKDVIIRLLNGYSPCRDVLLISSDKSLKDLAKELGARTMNAIEFFFDLKRVNRMHDKHQEKEKRINTEMTDNEVDQWMKIFGDD